MKNIFLCLTKANATLKTGGGDSQIFKHFWQYAACLLLAFFVGIGNVWGAEQSFSPAPSDGISRYTSEDNIINVYGKYVSGTMDGKSSQKMFTVAGNNPLLITSNCANIKAISFDICKSGSGSGTMAMIDVKYQGATGLTAFTSGTYTVTNSSDPEISALTSIKVLNGNSGHTDISITFNDNQSMIYIYKCSSGNGYIKNLEITYDNAITPPSLLTEVVATSTANKYTLTPETGTMDGSTSVGGSSNEITYSDVYYCKINNANTYTMASETSLSAGDVIVFDLAPGANDKIIGVNVTVGESTTLLSTTQKVPNIGGYMLPYIVPASATSFSFTKQNTETRIHGFTVYHAGSVDPDPEPSCEATAEAGENKATTVGVGVAMAATAASSGYTGAWSIKSGSPSTATSQLGTTSSNTMTFTPATYGTYTLVWTVTDDNDNTCSATDEATVTVPAPTHGISYTNLKGMDNSANPTSYSEGTGVASFAKLRHAVGYDFTGWSPSSISSSATTDQTIDAQWTANAVAEGTGSLTYALAFGSGTVTTSSITRVNGALYDATDVSLEHTSFNNNSTSKGCSGKLVSTTTKDNSNYVEVTFKVADGYTFTPTEVRVQGIAVSNNKTIEVELKDNAATPNSKSVSGTLTAVQSPTEGGYTVTLDFDATGEVALEGTVTAKIFAYGANDHWRIGTPFVITGTVASTATPSGYAIETSTEHGTIAVTDGSSTITSAEKDDVVYIAATPATGYGFTSWDIYKTSDATTKVSLLADDDSDNKTRKFSMPAYPVTVGATFSAINYTVTHNAASNGSYTIKVDDEDATDENTTANIGQTVTLSATPSSGYQFSAWDVYKTGESSTKVSVSSNTFTMPAYDVTISASFEEIECPTKGTVFSASVAATSAQSFDAGASNVELTASQATVTGGSMFVSNGQAEAKNLIAKKGSTDYYFVETNDNTFFKIVLDCALEAGDVITVDAYGEGSGKARGVWITPSSSKPGSAPACAGTTESVGQAVNYTVTSTDAYHGEKTFYIYRATGNTTNFNNISITRPEKFDVTYYKNDGSETKTEAEGSVVADNEFTRSGYRFIEWNTQADGKGTTKAVGAAVTADIELYAIWAQEYSVSYANTGAASGAAPTNENKYIAGETFKVAGVGSMVAAENYAFGGWDDGSNIYAEDDDYTVGSANVSFTPVWNLHYTVTYKANGGTGDDIVVDNPAKIADCVFETPENKLFDKWNTKAEGDGANYAVGADVSSSLILYAIWKDDECTTNRKSIFKAVLTGDATATVTGENGKEYAGDVLLNKLGGSDGNRNTNATIEGVGSGLTTYKMNGTGAYMYGTLKKGAFQEGDKIQFAVSSTPGTLAIYGTKSNDLSQRVHIADMPAPNEAKVFTYTLTAANATALAGYDAIGIYRADDVTMNPFLYSLEITGCRVWTITHDVTFDMKSHGTQVEKQTLEVGAKVTEPTEPEAAGYIFGGWYKETTLENKWNFSTDVVPDNDITLYAKWTEDPCTDRQSLSKVVLTSKTEGAVSGYNSKEYAGDAVIGGLNETQTAEVDDSHEGTETGYKLSGSGTGIVFATLAKGTFQEGDKVVVTITKQQDAYKVEEVAQPILDIYYGTSKDDATFLTTINNVTAAGTYTYRLTAADVTAIGDKKGIGVFRPSSGRTQNPYVYSVEITGCRDWSVSHNVTFNMHDHGSAIASQSVYEGGKVTKPAVVEPEGWAFDGWYKESTYENLWDFDVDVMGTSDIELHAKWESEAGVIKLFDGEGNLNTTNFISAAKTTIEISSVTYPTLVDFGSNRTSLAQAKQADMVMYSATTDATKIKFELYNANGSAKSAYLWLVEEGDAAATAIDVVEVPGNERLTTSYYTFNGTKNRSFYLTSGSKADIKVMQVKVMDNGTAIPQFGKAGYSVDFNKGRIAVASNGTVSFEGASIHSNDEYSVLNNESIKPKTYIQFNNAVANTTVKIKKASSNKYYVTNDLDNKGTEYSTDQEIVLTTTGTWYIGSVNSGSVAALSKIEFIAPKCEAPAFNALANSDICSGDAYVALDGTGTVSDGGSISYKWYADGDAENVLATTATYMPEADGSYYVVALHHVDGYTDNEATSDVVTVTTHEGTAITEGLAHVRKTAGEAATLTVEATGKDLHYAWKECETIDGTYTDVAGAADNKSLEIIVPDGVKYYKVIVSSGCGANQESIAKVEKFVPVAQVVVSTSVSWDLTTCADAQIQLTKTSSPKKGEEYLMANIEGVHMDENFHSESLVMSGEYIYRDVTGRPTCAEYMKFETSVPGLVRVHFAGNGSNRCLRITSSDGVQYSSVSTGTGNDLTEQFEVAAGEIELMGMNSGHTSDKQYMRFFQIEFYALDKVRDDSWIAPGELGTVCYPNGHIVVGADMYKMAGVDENHKFAFDQVTVTEPGVPYLFEATGYDPIKFYKTTAAAADEAGTSNGMVGTFVDKILTPAEGENLYYFQGAHFYSVADRTKNLSVPANRCYVDLNEPHPAMAPKAGVRRISFGVTGMNVTTGIENGGLINGENGAQKVLIDGQLFILRGEKMYDATGRLVK